MSRVESFLSLFLIFVNEFFMSNATFCIVGESGGGDIEIAAGPAAAFQFSGDQAICRDREFCARSRVA